MAVGYIIVQEVIPDAEHGDVRMLVMNGRPLMAGNQYAAFRRVNKTADGVRELGSHCG